MNHYGLEALQLRQEKGELKIPAESWLAALENERLHAIIFHANEILSRIVEDEDYRSGVDDEMLNDANEWLPLHPDKR